MKQDGVAPAERLREAWAAHRAGRAADARTGYEAVLAADPGNPDAQHLLGVLALQSGNLPEAERLIRCAFAARPARPDIAANLVTALLGAGKPREAEQVATRALAGNPEETTLLLARADARRESGMVHQAVADCRRALANDDGQPQPWVSLALALQKRGDFRDAEAALQQALDRAPSPDIWYSLGAVRQSLGRLADAEAAYRQAVASGSRDFRAFSNLATVVRDQGRLDEALGLYGQAEALCPDPALIAFNKALLLLAMGRFDEGWRLYDDRFASPAFPWRRPATDKALWDGEPVRGAGIAVHAEQGVGDQIMFAQLFPALAATGMQPVVECEARLVPLFERSMPGIRFVARGERPQPALTAPEISCQAPLASLARRLRPTPSPDTAPAAYLRADAGRAAACRERYKAQGDGLLVGLSWRSGNAAYGAARSLSLDDLAPVLAVPGIRFVNLQYGDVAREVEAARRGGGAAIYRDPAIDLFGDLDGLAAATAAMDLVVTIDNVTAHMAGALGVPALVLLPSIPEWRWGTAGDASAWYRSLTLFRQTVSGSWREVAGAVAAALAVHGGEASET